MYRSTFSCTSGGTPEKPSLHYIREMKRYEILPREFNPETDPLDVYKTDEAY